MELMVLAQTVVEEKTQGKRWCDMIGQVSSLKTQIVTKKK